MRVRRACCGRAGTRLVRRQPVRPTFLLLGVTINLALVFFNLIPIPPLDGSKILFGLLPAGHARGYERVMAQWGLPLFLLLVFTRITSL